jgi:hypothetical protein
MSQNGNEAAATQSLDNVLAAILGQADAGTVVNREEWLARYPQFADALAEFFADEERVGRWTAPLDPDRSGNRGVGVSAGTDRADRTLLRRLRDP